MQMRMVIKNWMVLLYVINCDLAINDLPLAAAACFSSH